MKVGVVVARFQVDELTQGHEHLLRSVASGSDAVVVVLGYDENKGSRRNPLDFLTRKIMVENWWRSPENAAYAHIPLIVLPKHNRSDDQFWSDELDKSLLEMFPGQSVRLYGGRDSFLTRYVGKLAHDVILGPESQPGTSVRQEIARVPGASRDFRRGVIYGAYDQWPRVFMCVDVALMYKGQLVLGKRASEHKFRFFGGFVGQYESLEQAARRELCEEAGVVRDVKYLGSFTVDDYRYRSKDDGTVLTTFFLAEDLGLNETPKAGDDIDSIVYADLDLDEAAIIENMVNAHKPLMRVLLDHLKSKKASK